MNTKLTNGKGDTLVVKYSKTNVHIDDSYAVAKADIADWVEQIRSFGEMYGYEYDRPKSSWRREWKAHNVLYRWGVEPNRTRDVDLNEGETLARRIAYYFLSFLCIK